MLFRLEVYCTHLLPQISLTKRLNVFFVGFSLSQLQGGESQMLPGEHLITSYDGNGRLVTEFPVASVGPTLFVAIGERKRKRKYGGFFI